MKALSACKILLEHISDKDVYEVMRGSTRNAENHSHSEAAFDMLKQFHVGRLSRCNLILVDERLYANRNC
jgi:hypothetical protein